MSTFDNACKIELRRRNRPSLWATVDVDDYVDLLAAGPWHVMDTTNSGTVYAVRSVRRPDGRKTSELMHRHLMPNAEYVDHINGNGLDNRRSNLRPATNAENMRNRRGPNRNNGSGFLGVSWSRQAGKWRADIMHNGRQHHLGYFATPEAAAKARDAKALELHGEYASLNFAADAA